MTTTSDALMRAILVNPADDTPRLVYADWLEENGESERAEFVRVQIQAARCEVCHGKRTFHYGDYLCHNCQPYCDRGRELFDALGLSDERAAAFRMPAGCYVEDFDNGTPAGPPFTVKAIVRRGFVSAVRCRLVDWVGGESLEYYARRNIGSGRFVTTDDVETRSKVIPALGPRIVAEQPVERVEVSDKRPQYTRDEGWSWWARGNDEDGVGELIFPFLKGGSPVPDLGRGDAWPTEPAAQSALSLALVNWARREAGLPPLEERK